MARRALLLGLLGLLVVAFAVPGAPAQTAGVELSVDATHTLGPVNSNVVGFAFRPPADRAPWAPLRPGTFRVDAGIENLVACPSATIHPDRLQVLQRYLDSVDASGADTILILSYTPPCMADVYPGDPRDPTKAPPRDPAAWERLITDLVTAVGPGRVAAGHRPVKYYEVWNEPDWPVFFQGSPTQFADNIALPAGKAVAAVAERSGLDLRYGVCGCLAPDPVYMVPLLTKLRDAKVPVGFVSWHYYGNYPFLGPDGPEPFFPKEVVPAYPAVGQRNPAASPQSYAVQIEAVRRWVGSALGSVPELMIDEWNLSAGGFDKRMDTHEGAAFQAATMATFADSRLDRAALFSDLDPYERDVNGQPLPARYGGWGVIDRTGARKPAWYAQWMWSRLEGARIASPQDPASGLWTAAAVTAAKHRVDVLASSFTATGGSARQLHVRVAGLAPGAWHANLYRVDTDHPGSTDPAEAIHVVADDAGRVSIDAELPAQAVLLVELTRAAPASAKVLAAQVHGMDGSPRQDSVGGGVLPATGPPGWLSPVLPLSAVGAALALRRYRTRGRRGRDDGRAERAAGGISGGAGRMAS